jgi:hypothetical protein
MKRLRAGRRDIGRPAGIIEKLVSPEEYLWAINIELEHGLVDPETNSGTTTRHDRKIAYAH